MNRNFLIIVLISCFFIAPLANAAPRINVLQTESGLHKKDIRVIITEESEKQIDYQSLSLLINGKKISKNKIDDLSFTAIDKSILDFTLHRIRTKQPLEFEISISNSSGDSSVMREIIGKNQNDDVTLDSEPDRQYKTIALASISSSAIWKKALSMAKRGTPNGLIKAYLESKGYVCLPGLPFFFCTNKVAE